MKLSEIISPEALIPELRSDNRNEVFGELLSVLVGAGLVESGDYESILEALIERESNGSTGFGKGVAVPHCQHVAVKNPVVAIGHSTSGLDFAALDHAPVYSVVLLLSPADEQDSHLQAMELIFRHLQQSGFRKALRQAGTSAGLRELIITSESTEAD